MIDINEGRLNMALSSYPEISIINPLNINPEKFILEDSMGRGVDLAFEAIGHASTLAGRLSPVESAIKAIRGGGRLCVLGLSSEPTSFLMKELIWKEAEIISSRVSHGEFATSLETLNKKQFDPSNMITAVMNLMDIQAAFELLEKDPDNQLKILIEI